MTNMISNKSLLWVTCVMILLQGTSSYAADANSCVQSENDIQAAKKHYYDNLSMAENEVEKCCNDKCSSMFSADNLDLYSNLFSLTITVGSMVLESRKPSLKSSTSFQAIKNIAPVVAGLLNSLAKLRAGNSEICTDENKVKEKIKIRRIREAIEGLTSKQLKDYCLEVRASGNVPKDLSERISEMAKILRAESAYPVNLDNLNSDCNQVSLDKARSYACVSAIFRHCVGLNFRGGIAQEVPTHSISAVCLSKNNSKLKSVSYELLRSQSSQGALCPISWLFRKADLTACHRNARALCQEDGYESGYIQDGNQQTVDIICFNSRLERIAFGVLTQLNPRCDSIKNASHPFCASAAHAYCLGAGYVGGVIQQENPDNSVIVACFNGKVNNIPFSDQVPAYK